MYFVFQIRSDKEDVAKINYFLSGPGCDEPPIGRFGVDKDTGKVKVYSILDREEIAFYRVRAHTYILFCRIWGIYKHVFKLYIEEMLRLSVLSLFSFQLRGIAKFLNRTLAERDVYLNITVLDRNDNSPVIKEQQVGFVNESSAEGILGFLLYICAMAEHYIFFYFYLCWTDVLLRSRGGFLGTTVMRVIATDADQENTLHSKISYRIVEQSSTAGMFFINSQTGEVMVRQSTLDREVSHLTDLKVFFLLASRTNSVKGRFQHRSRINIHGYFFWKGAWFLLQLAYML